MAYATGAQTSIAQLVEATWGTTPATPELTLFPVTKANYRPSKDTYESKDIRSDRQTADLRHGFQSSMLDFDFELKHGQFDWLLEAALFGAWSSNVIKGGTTRKSFVIEQSFGDITRFVRSNGMMVNRLGLKIGTDGIITGSASLVGKQLTAHATTVDHSAGYTAPAAKSSMSSYQLTINEGGSAIATVTSVEMAIENGIEPAKIVGSTFAPDMFSGRQKVSGTLSAFFTDATLLNKFLNETDSSLSLVLSDPAANTLTLLLPKIKYTGGEAPTEGEGGIVLNMPFVSVYDGTEETTIKITRSA